MTISWHNPSSDAHEPQWHLSLVGFVPGEALPEVVVQALDASAKPLFVAEVDSQGYFGMPAAILDRAHQVVVGPTALNTSAPGVKTILRYRPSQFAKLLQSDALFVPRCIWTSWFIFVRCMTGGVQLPDGVAGKCIVKVFRRQCSAPSQLWEGMQVSIGIRVDDVYAGPYRHSGHAIHAEPRQVAQGKMDPDGRFAICWLEFPDSESDSRDEYAFVVTQATKDEKITVYDGIENGIWFDERDVVLLDATRSHTDLRVS